MSSYIVMSSSFIRHLNIFFIDSFSFKYTVYYHKLKSRRNLASEYTSFMILFWLLKNAFDRIQHIKFKMNVGNLLRNLTIFLHIYPSTGLNEIVLTNQRRDKITCAIKATTWLVKIWGRRLGPTNQGQAVNMLNPYVLWGYQLIE